MSCYRSPYPFPRPSIMIIAFILVCLTNDADACCYKMRVACRTSWFNSCDWQAHTEHPELYQLYYRQSFDLNGHDVWKSADGNYGIWKTDVQEKWYIGYWDSRGQRRGFAMSEMPGKSEGSDCPLDSDSEDWVYTSGGNWYNGKKSIKPWCV